MSVTVQIPSSLRIESGIGMELSVEASTVAEALVQLEANHPSLYRCVCDETGAVRRHINLFVNSILARGELGLNTELKSGDVLSIMTAVSGG